MDPTPTEKPAPSSSSDAGGRACGECGTALRSGAEFCVDCGAPAGAGGPESTTCGECGTALRAGAAFCTECGATRSAAAAVTAAAAPVSAAVVDAVASTGTASAAEPGGPSAPDDAPAGSPGRSANPHESRTILASVGATGYTSPRNATAVPPVAPVALATASGGSGGDSKRKLLALVAVIAVLAVAAIVIVAATQGKDENSVQAGRRGVNGELLSSRRGGQGATDSGSADTGTSAASTTVTTKKHQKKSSTTSTVTTAKPRTTTTAKPSSSGSTTPTTKKPASGPKKGGGTTGPTATTATTAPPPPPGKLSVGATSVNLGTSSPSATIRINNDGGRSLNWTANATIAGIHGGAVSPHSGHLAPHSGVYITVSYSPSGSIEGSQHGSFHVDGYGTGGGTVSVSAGAGSSMPDAFARNVYAPASRCTVGSKIFYYVLRRAAGGATPSAITATSMESDSGSGAFSAATAFGTKTLNDPDSGPGVYDVFFAVVQRALPNLNITLHSTDAAGNTVSKHEVHGC